MICQNCGQHEATICVVKITGNKTEKQYICQYCVNKLNENFNNIINPFLGSIMELNNWQPGGDICPTCGQSKRKWEETGKLNCKDCYNFLNISKKHIGKRPIRNQQELYLINILKEKQNQLKKLIEQEKYEEAAILRDEIKGLKENKEDKND